MIRALCLMIFAFGVAIVVQTLGFNEWVYQHEWIGFPMMLVGGLGLCIYLGR